MDTIIQPKTDWKTLAHRLGKDFAKRAAESDLKGTFVNKNYQQLKKHQLFSAMIPEELGGGGMSHTEMCHFIKVIAQYCGSTALAFSMHQHLIAATAWKYKHKGEGEAMLRKVVDQQLVLISTGARDWLASNGELTKTEGGYLFTAKKAFASQSVAGDVAVTSGPYLNENKTWQVLHFSVPMKEKGVAVINDWDVLGMRATGSATIQFDQVFVPDSAVALARPRDGFHPVWDIVLTVAMPLIMSAYVGIAERAFDIAVTIGRKYARQQNHLPYIIGQLNNTLISAKSQWKAMYALTSNLDFQPNESTTMDILSYKTNVADATIATVSGAMEAIGGQGFYRKNELERLFRDVQAAAFHPLPKWEQYAFTGSRILV
ncbi:MAG: BEC protein [Saprospiraceae bacterium]|nr:MAG: BEC protein [Saprospiraceae bacterium]